MNTFKAIWSLQTVHNNRFLQRPKNKKLYYSGKKGKYTVKNLFTVNQKELILYKSNHKQEVEKHDYLQRLQN